MKTETYKLVDQLCDIAIAVVGVLLLVFVPGAIERLCDFLEGI